MPSRLEIAFSRLPSRHDSRYSIYFERGRSKMEKGSACAPLISPRVWYPSLVENPDSSLVATLTATEALAEALCNMQAIARYYGKKNMDVFDSERQEVMDAWDRERQVARCKRRILYECLMCRKIGDKLNDVNAYAVELGGTTSWSFTHAVYDISLYRTFPTYVEKPVSGNSNDQWLEYLKAFRKLRKRAKLPKLKAIEIHLEKEYQKLGLVTKPIPSQDNRKPRKKSVEKVIELLSKNVPDQAVADRTGESIRNVQKIKSRYRENIKS